jgi:NAD-dependent SIR2 family protein deacetylase
MNENNATKIEKLKELIANSRNVVFFGGAGVSTESGIPDFRGAGGLYTEDGKGNEYGAAQTLWSKISGSTKYEFQLSSSSKFTKSTTKTVTVTKYATVSRVIASLTKGKTYYVRMRTYKTVSGKKYYSVWSAVKKLKLTK